MKRLVVVLACLAFGCTGVKRGVVSDNMKFAAGQFKVAIAEVEATRAVMDSSTLSKKPLSPRSIEPDGSLRLAEPRDWTSGFFPGELWFVYKFTKDEYWAAQARRFTEPLEGEKSNGTTHDMGFKMMCSFGQGYLLTGDAHYKDVLMESAKTLCGRFNPVVGAIRSWDHNAHRWKFPVIIDNMMNLELLFWAWQQSGDSTFYKIADAHAMTTLNNHFRPDNSSYHVVDYDPQTGKATQHHTHQGYSHESAWSRGQAWGVYGYTMCYRFTGRKEYLEQAGKIAHYIFSHPNMPSDLISYWDFNAPNIPDEPRDVSAATVTASALYELSKYDKSGSGQYKDWADTIIDNLTAFYRTKPGGDRGFLLLHSTGAKSLGFEIDVPIVYGDYYFLEALLRKKEL